MYTAQNTKGMTLIEMVVVIAVYTILVGVIFSSIQSLYQYNAYSLAQNNEIDSARRGLLTLTRDAREMTPAEDGTFPIAVKEPHRIGFYSDIDKDNSVEYVEYQLATTTTFYKRVYNPIGSPPVYNLSSPSEEYILSTYVQNIVQNTPTFLYYDTNGVLLNGTSLLTDVRYIEAKIIVNIDPIRSPGEFMLQSGIAPRNLKDNL